MITRLFSATLRGVEAQEVEVNAHGTDKPMIVIVGLPDAAVVDGIRVFPIRNLREAWRFLTDKKIIPSFTLDRRAFFDAPGRMRSIATKSKASTKPSVRSKWPPRATPIC